jgi:NodT family efflux transporter outer membrane factor (OMF) lipoprotein
MSSTKTKMAGRPLAVAVVAGIALSGCTVGPDFVRPPPPQTPRYTETPLPPTTAAAPGPAGTPQRFVPDADLPAQWWSLFRSPALDELIKQALAENPTLAAAEAALREARENLAAGKGELLYPQVDANAGATREKISGSQLGNPNLGSTIFSLYNANVSVSYMLDLFGRERRAVEGLEAQVDYQAYLLEGAHIALTANVATAAVRDASLRAQIRSTQEIIAAQEQQLKVVERQFQLGAVSKADVLAQRAQLEQTRVTLPPLERELAQTRHQIAVLAGRLPSLAALPEFELEALALPQEIPLGVPSELVHRRPDILAAEAQLHTASAEVGVATANLYPQITLTGSFGGQSAKLGDFFSSPSVWSIAAGLAQPLFHGGALTARRRATIAAFDQSAAQYRQTVLSAFQNVADALRALADDSRTLAAQAVAEQVARESLALAERQFRLGAVSYVTLLNAQRQYHLARILLTRAQADRYADTAALFQALGGGWWNEPASATATSRAD